MENKEDNVKGLNSNLSRKGHEIIHVPKEDVLTCKLCKFVTDDKINFYYHLRTHFEKQYECNECRRMSLRQKALKLHNKGNKDYYKYLVKCEYMYRSNSRTHLRSIDRIEKEVCESCGKKPELGNKSYRKTLLPIPIAPQYLNQIRRSNLQGPNHQSKPLALVFKRDSMLSPPISVKDEPLEKTKLNEKCVKNELLKEKQLNKVLVPEIVRGKPNKNDLKASTERDVKVEPLKEKEANEVLILEPKKDDLKEKFTCENCKITYGIEILYLEHMSFHDDETPFKCTTCIRIFDNEIEFNRHLLTNRH